MKTTSANSETPGFRGYQPKTSKRRRTTTRMGRLDWRGAEGLPNGDFPV